MWGITAQKAMLPDMGEVQHRAANTRGVQAHACGWTARSPGQDPFHTLQLVIALGQHAGQVAVLIMQLGAPLGQFIDLPLQRYGTVTHWLESAGLPAARASHEHLCARGN